jgi:hypothetical protein
VVNSSAQENIHVQVQGQTLGYKTHSCPLLAGGFAGGFKLYEPQAIHLKNGSVIRMRERANQLEMEIISGSKALIFPG